MCEKVGDLVVGIIRNAAENVLEILEGLNLMQPSRSHDSREQKPV
jgi:hypothetical protein